MVEHAGRSASKAGCIYGARVAVTGSFDREGTRMVILLILFIALFSFFPFLVIRGVNGWECGGMKRLSGARPDAQDGRT